jgi:7-alpha-hydroxysteroid dehydrogenase
MGILADDSIRHQMEANTPMGRVGQPEDIAACVVYLTSPASSWVAGKVFEIDGAPNTPPSPSRSPPSESGPKMRP